MCRSEGGRGRLQLGEGEGRRSRGWSRPEWDVGIWEVRQGKDSAGWQEPQEKRFCTEKEEAMESQSVQGSLGYKETSHLQRSEGNFVSLKDRFNYKVADIRSATGRS